MKIEDTKETLSHGFLQHPGNLSRKYGYDNLYVY